MPEWSPARGGLTTSQLRREELGQPLLDAAADDGEALRSSSAAIATAELSSSIPATPPPVQRERSTELPDAAVGVDRGRSTTGHRNDVRLQGVGDLALTCRKAVPRPVSIGP